MNDPEQTRKKLVVPKRAEAEGIIGDAFIELTPGTDEYKAWETWIEETGQNRERYTRQID